MEDFEIPQSLSLKDYVPEELSMIALIDGKDTTIHLQDYQDKWKIFFFYPGDFTFVCPTELQSLAERHADFAKENVEIFAISTDSVFVHKAWKDNSPAVKDFNFPLVSDRNGEISMLFGVYNFEQGMSERGTFVVDPDNMIRVVELHDESIGRNADELLRKLCSAKYTRDNAGKVCPANWTKGADDLAPSIDLVGKI